MNNELEVLVWLVYVHIHYQNSSCRLHAIVICIYLITKSHVSCQYVHMKWNFEGKVAVVTGASRGIGEATVRQFDDGGANVVLVSRVQGQT